MYLFTERFLYLFDILLDNLFEFVLSMKAKVHAFMLIMGFFLSLLSTTKCWGYCSEVYQGPSVVILH